MAKFENADIAIDTISNLSVVGSSIPQTSADTAVEEGNIEIFLRLDTPRNIAGETKEQKTEVSSLTNILINQPEEEAAVRQSKCIQLRNVEEDSEKKI